MSDTVTLLARVPVSIRWRDLDAFNHVNNSVFLTYLEEARLDWLSKLPEGWMTDTCKPVMAASEINYRAQIEWPGTIVVELYSERIGNSSIKIAHRIVSSDGTRLHSDGHVVVVWIDTTSGRPASLPEVVRQHAQIGLR